MTDRSKSIPDGGAVWGIRQTTKGDDGEMSEESVVAIAIREYLGRTPKRLELASVLHVDPNERLGARKRPDGTVHYPLLIDAVIDDLVDALASYYALRVDADTLTVEKIASGRLRKPLLRLAKAPAEAVDRMIEEAPHEVRNEIALNFPGGWMRFESSSKYPPQDVRSAAIAALSSLPQQGSKAGRPSKVNDPRGDDLEQIAQALVDVHRRFSEETKNPDDSIKRSNKQTSGLTSFEELVRLATKALSAARNKVGGDLPGPHARDNIAKRAVKIVRGRPRTQS